MKVLILLVAFLPINGTSFALPKIKKSDSTSVDVSDPQTLLFAAREILHTKPELSRKFALKSLSIARHDHNPGLEAMSRLIIGASYNMNGNVDSAATYIYEALRIFESIGDENGVSESHMSLGALHCYIKDYDKAISHWNICLRYCKRTNNIRKLGMIYYNLGLAYSDTYMFDKAMDSYFKAEAYMRQTDNTLGIARLLQSIAFVKLEKGLADEALKYSFESLQLTTDIADQFGLQQLCLIMGRTYIALNELDSAKKYLLHGVKIDSVTHNIDALSNIYNNLSIISELQDSLELSQKYFKKFIHYREQYTAPSVIKHASEQEKKYELGLKNLEIETAQEKLKSKNHSIELLILILAAVGVITLLLLSRYRVNKKLRLEEKKVFDLERTQMITKLDGKNKELVSKAILLGKQNQIIGNIYEKLNHLSGSNNTSTNNTLAELINDIRLSQNTYSWKEFERLFLDVHKDFYINLQKKYPSLTLNERRVCAFLRLNMTTKEISDITLQSQRAITVARYRLRKKLNIGEDEDLIAILLSI